MKRIFLILLLLSGNAWATNYCNDANIIACLKMNVDENPLTDSGGLGHTGALDSAGNPAYSATAPLGYTAGSYVFTDDKISLGDHADYSSEAGASGLLTIVAWVKFNTVSTTLNQRNFIITKGDATQYEYAINSTGDGSNAKFSGRVWDSSGTDIYTSTLDGTTSISTGTWYHVAMVYDKAGNSGKLYVNGVFEVSSATSGTATNGTAALLIGKRQDNPASTALDGSVTQVGLFSRALSQTEIQNIMNYGLDGTQTGRLVSINVSATADTGLSQNNPTTNYGTDTTAGTLSTTDDLPELFKFDYSAIPGTATVYSAVIGLYETTRDSNHSVVFKRILQNWNETQATWDIYSTGNSWNTVGALGSDVDFSSSNTVVVGNANGGWVYATVTSIVSSQLSSNNYGILVRPSGTTDGDVYSTRESGSNNPYMQIVYTAAETTSHTNTIKNSTIRNSTIN